MTTAVPRAKHGEKTKHWKAKPDLWNEKKNLTISKILQKDISERKKIDNILHTYG
jgi:hypothetical protein